MLILTGDIIYLEDRFFQHEFFDFCFNNYSATYMICGNHELFNPSFSFLEEVLRIKKQGTIIAIAHHAPSIYCNVKEHKNSALISAFVYKPILMI